MVTRMVTRIVTAAAASVLVNAACLGQGVDAAKLDRFFERLSEKNKAMGMVEIARNGSVEYGKAIGYARLGERKQPWTAETRFRIGSVTKMFTAVIVFQLVEEKKLALTQTLDRFVPRIANAERITIEQMLSHRSGIHDVFEDSGFRKAGPISREELIEAIAKGAPDFEPGAKTAYSNAGYVLLATVIENVTGKSYAEVVEQRVCSKIGLKNTYLGTGNGDAAESVSYRFSRDWEEQPGTHLSVAVGAGALISTPGDLLAFVQALFEGRLVSRTSLDQMTTNEMGIEAFSRDGRTSYGHTGGIENFGSWVEYQPQEKLAVVYATNAKVYPVSDIMKGVFSILAGQAFEIPSFDAAPVAADVLARYVGVYAKPGAPVKFKITSENGKLYAEMTGKSAQALVPAGENAFKVEGGEVVLRFDIEKRQMTIVRNGQERVLNKE